MTAKDYLVAGYLIGFFVTALIAKVMKKISLLNINRDISFALALVVGIVLLLIPVLLITREGR